MSAMSATSDVNVLRLAEAAGVATEWTDAFGVPQTVAPDTLRTILNALELPCATDAQCQESMARLAAENDDPSLPPLITAQVGMSLRLGSTRMLSGQRYRIEFEDGGHVEGRFESNSSLPLEIPAIDRYGYHRLLVGDVETTLAVAPSRCFSVSDASPGNEHLWGLAVQLYALRRAGDGGIGDFTGLKTMVQAAARHGAAALAISPVHAMFSADHTRFSPYAPSSRLFLNVLHIDPAAVLGEDALAKAIADMDMAGKASAKLERLELIDWPEAAELKLGLLRHLYWQFTESGSGDQQAFNEFRLRGGEALADHACFEALHAKFAADWRAWPASYHDPRGAAVQAFADEHADEIGFHAFLQWQASRGLLAAQKAARDAGMPLGLIADLAVGAETGGSQAWSRQGEMINGLSIGAPPDLLSTRGQNWGLGAFSPRAMQSKGFRAYIEMLRSAFAHAGGVRIDHVLGLARIWLVPDGVPADQGAYLRYPLEDLLRLIALESWRHRAIVIGEDLGTVPDGFDDLLARAGVLGIRVLWFQRDEQGFLAPEDWSSHAIATTTTHDLPSIAGWWSGRDISWRVKLDLLEAGASEASERAARADDRTALWQAFADADCAIGDPQLSTVQAAPVDEAIAFLAATQAPLAMLPIEDALGLPEQPNVPGTTESHPNWRRRLPQPVEGLLDDPAVAARLSILNSVRHIKRERQ